MADSTDDGAAGHTLTRREAWKLGGAAVGAVAAARFWPSRAAAARVTRFRAPAAPPWNHDPASPIGPDHWGAIGYPVCASGAGQSPVDIDTRAVRRVTGPPLTLSYVSSELIIENTGHYVEVPIPADVTDTLRAGPGTYRLTQYHFHAPSEHQINGRPADLEAHYVHQDSQGVTAVVGIFFRAGRDPNPLLDKILRNAPVTAGQEVTIGEASPAELFPQTCSRHAGKLTVGSFYSYNGSLTTPGCTEGVRWFLLADGGHVSHAAVRRFHHLISQFPSYGGYPGNNRPVQPLNGRIISFRHGHHDG